VRALALAALLLSCSPRPVAPGGPDACPAACARLRALGCAAGSPTPAGRTCEAWCDATERTGYATMHPACVAVARDCDEADRVSAEGCK